jgi:thioredoxin reductase
MQYEVIIVGGGVAGLSGALVLARCRRRVLICDDGRPRNAVSRGVHGFLTRDGLPPAEFLQVAREQVLRYPTVTWWDGRVEQAERLPGGFQVMMGDGRRATGSKLLLATGLVDELPTIAGFQRFWGQSAFVCPFCDAWEVRDQRFVVLGRDPDVYAYTLELRQWSRELFLCTDGAEPLNERQRAHLQRLGIPVIATPVAELEGTGSQVERLRFGDGSALETGVVFLTTRQHQRSPLGEALGCALNGGAEINVDPETCAAADGVWIAGNASIGLQMAIMAAAEGLNAAHAINERLVEDELAGT